MAFKPLYPSLLIGLFRKFTCNIIIAISLLKLCFFIISYVFAIVD